MSGNGVYQELGATDQLTDHEGVHFANKTGCIFQFLSLDAAGRGIESMRFPQAPRNGPRGKNMERNNEKSEDASFHEVYCSCCRCFLESFSRLPIGDRSEFEQQSRN